MNSDTSLNPRLKYLPGFWLHNACCPFTRLYSVKAGRLLSPAGENILPEVGDPLLPWKACGRAPCQIADREKDTGTGENTSCRDNPHTHKNPSERPQGHRPRGRRGRNADRNSPSPPTPPRPGGGPATASSFNRNDSLNPTRVSRTTLALMAPAERTTSTSEGSPTSPPPGPCPASMVGRGGQCEWSLTRKSTRCCACAEATTGSARSRLGGPVPSPRAAEAGPGAFREMSLGRRAPVQGLPCSVSPQPALRGLALCGKPGGEARRAGLGVGREGCGGGKMASLVEQRGAVGKGRVSVRVQRWSEGGGRP